MKDKAKEKMIQEVNNEIEIVRNFCHGLVHPLEQSQPEFTAWLQNTVIFHLNNLKRRIE